MVLAECQTLNKKTQSGSEAERVDEAYRIE